MSENIFVDGAVEIRIAGGAIRLDLASYSSDKKDKNQNPMLEKTGHTLIMTPEGFVQLYAALEKVAARLTDVGILRKKEKVNN
ncbi:MAG: hypothetical protein JRJ44_01635 [Deltaproteobacteria bacterium]|nr:hypothetical protein [Deltaproteobacteria bacterium]